MMIYALEVSDRHTDVEVYTFSDAATAIEAAKRIAKLYAVNKKEYREIELDNWLFYAEYSCESDYVCVHETKLDECAL